MSTGNPAADPAHSCSVLASAGTGKTWQLVARLTRLLLGGARLDSLLAITFTRKAAGEMQERLNERLRQLLEADDLSLDQLLEEIGEVPDAPLRARARELFESTLRSEQRLRASTFHSFCQDLLQRFPLEAGLPPGFELAEETGLLVNEAWDALFAEVTATPQQPLALALSQLFASLGGLHNSRAALFAFVGHRSDWWAYTQDCADPVGEAVARLADKLDIRAESAAGDALFSPTARAELSEFQALLQKHDTATNRRHAQLLQTLEATPSADADHLSILYPVFFTTGDQARKRKAGKTQRKAMGEDGERRFLHLHDLFCERIAALREQHRRRRTLEINSAWYRAGARLLEHFQRLKRERRLLDFADLEWHAYRLLNHPDHAHWIQYKLDQRIEHLLIDEFQDTNPTQWRLILPLLEEIAAGGERRRSLFIVGDAKQSIYRFRRGNPRLLNAAADWMHQHLHAPRIHLDRSWRSSPLIMDCVNTLFQHPQMQGLLEDFQAHATQREHYWGRIEIWPLIEAGESGPSQPDSGALRNPLLQPRPYYRDRRHYQEGEAIAQRIRRLVDEGFADYDDVLILMRSRTYLADYEAALRDQQIPYLSLDRGTLLHSLEIRDLEALLMVLITPQDNLSLAQALRSPVFSASDEDLLRLAAEHSGSWYERLQALAPGLHAEHALARAARLLGQWHALAGRIPIHDLLQSMFHQANLMARFCAAFPASEQARVQANLTRFIELALEVDAGRYPTLSRFLERLRQLRSLDKEGPSQATPHSDDNRRVRLLTIHAAKGLEAPVVFLVDSARESSADPGMQALVCWPAQHDRPTDFVLLGNRKQRDAVTQHSYELEQHEERRESANLLYVALTRARHMLVISGCAASRLPRETPWYQQLVSALCTDADPPLAQPWVSTHLEPTLKPASRPPQRTEEPVDARLRATLKLPAAWQEIAPSRSVEAGGEHGADRDGTLRGQVIHRLLQLASDRLQPATLRGSLLRQVANEYRLAIHDARLEAWWDEALAVLSDNELAWVMRPGKRWRVYKEMPVHYRLHGSTVFGVLDRLLVSEQRIHVIDYKSHRLASEAQTARLLALYQPQMALYRDGLQKLWPRREIACYLLLTADRRLIQLPQ